MIHPSYTDLMAVVNSEVEPGEQPVVNSRYSIVLATAKRARQIIAGDEPLVKAEEGKKPLSIAVQELYEGKIKIMGEDKNYYAIFSYNNINFDIETTGISEGEFIQLIKSIVK